MLVTTSIKFEKEVRIAIKSKQTSSQLKPIRICGSLAALIRRKRMLIAMMFNQYNYDHTARLWNGYT